MALEVIGLVRYDPEFGCGMEKQYECNWGWRVAEDYARTERVAWCDEEHGCLEVCNDKYDQGMRNFVGYGDGDTDRLLAGAYESQDPSEQQAYMKEIHRRLSETAPYVFLWSLRNFSAISWDVTGAHIQAYYYFSQFPDWDIKKE